MSLDRVSAPLRTDPDDVVNPASILFVCTGNICRSPLAEAVARQALSILFQVSDLSTVGLHVASAGTHGLTGHPATAEMQAVAAEMGVDLAGHRATRVDRDMLERTSLVYAMEVAQITWLDRHFPGIQANLLGEATIDDPYGLSMSDYRRAGREIAEGVRLRASEMAGLADRPPADAER